MSVAEAAEFLGCSGTHIRNAIKRGDLKAVRLGKRIFLHREALATFVESAR